MHEPRSAAYIFSSWGSKQMNDHCTSGKGWQCIYRYEEVSTHSRIIQEQKNIKAFSFPSTMSKLLLHAYRLEDSVYVITASNPPMTPKHSYMPTRTILQRLAGLSSVEISGTEIMVISRAGNFCRVPPSWSSLYAVQTVPTLNPVDFADLTLCPRSQLSQVKLVVGIPKSTTAASAQQGESSCVNNCTPHTHDTHLVDYLSGYVFSGR